MFPLGVLVVRVRSVVQVVLLLERMEFCGHFCVFVGLGFFF